MGVGIELDLNKCTKKIESVVLITKSYHGFNNKERQ